MIDAQVCLMKLLSNECDWTLLYDDDKPTLVWIMAWCHQTTRHYPSQCHNVVLLGHSELIFVERSVLQYCSFQQDVKFSYWANGCLAWRSGVFTFKPFGAETEYPARTRSVPSLLMPWLHPSPGHCQSWYGLCRIMADNSTALGLHIQRDREKVYIYGNAGSCLIKCQGDLGLTLMTGILTMPPMSLPFSQSPI